MKITFKDVGQGDSIVLEWLDGEESKIGIIDCNKRFKSNPVVDHLKIVKPKCIDFIVLSHPHHDHFSGMLELLEYLEGNNIVIKKFAHTLLSLREDYVKYLKWVEVDTEALEDLQKLIFKISSLKDRKLIGMISSAVEGWQEELSANIYLRCISPGPDEISNFISVMNDNPESNKKKASASANFLSTAFCVVNGEDYFLLTSDCESSSFARLLEQNSHIEFQKKHLYLGQLPHHGSKKNHFKPFWDFLLKKAEKHAVASAGSKYRHPHFSVLRSFHDDGFVVKCTNLFNGSKEYLEYLERISRISSKLDSTSQMVSSYTSGDKIFPS